MKLFKGWHAGEIAGLIVLALLATGIGVVIAGFALLCIFFGGH